MAYHFKAGDKVVVLNQPTIQAGIIIADYNSRALLLIDSEKKGAMLINLRKCNNQGFCIMPYEPERHTEVFLPASFESLYDLIGVIRSIEA